MNKKEVNDLKQVIEKLLQWKSDEQEILDDLAHDVAQTSSVEKMVCAKQSYDLQKSKVDTIVSAIELVHKTK
ncbi:hypothetical protein [Sporosarcina obsidiansis]|uniref:hypothetical protein n=1 Tax=Sporosarcina obsidiansis TaxID=2660748 RepID=UPI00129A1605|nr:hypothetical protein [Sporosarcina obsidiansis]